jgi:hypothetical protein
VGLGKSVGWREEVEGEEREEIVEGLRFEVHEQVLLKCVHLRHSMVSCGMSDEGCGKRSEFCWCGSLCWGKM